MRKGKTYRHRNCIDMDMWIIKIQYLGPRYMKLKICWVNRFNPNILHPDHVTVQLKDMCNWAEVA